MIDTWSIKCQKVASEPVNWFSELILLTACLHSLVIKYRSVKMSKYQLGYVELQGKKKSYFWEVVGSILLGILCLVFTFGLFLI